MAAIAVPDHLPAGRPVRPSSSEEQPCDLCASAFPRCWQPPRRAALPPPTIPTQPQYIEPLARCAPAGVPKSLIWHGYEVRQYPGYVVFLFDSGTRIIRLDGRPHLPDTIKSWNADSRGHWEGNTLVVDVANNNAKALFGRTGDFASENVHIVERYIFANDRKRYNYVARLEDPTAYARPWTATIPARRYTEADPAGGGWHYEAIVANRPGHQPVLNERMERICVENNGPFGGGAIGVPLTDTIVDR